SLKLKFFDLSFRTAYAQAKELALAQRQIPLLTAGTLQTEKRAGKRFVYRYRYDASGKRITEYLGPADDADTAARVERANAEISEAAILAGYSRDLRKVGFHSTDNSALVTVAALFNAGIFGSGGILVGTHAFAAILNELGVADTSFAMTEDVDLARAGPIQIAALPQGGLLKLLSETGLPFREVPQLKREEPPNSFKVRGMKLKVDLLVPAKGEPFKPVAVRELGAHATGLPHLKFLLEKTTQSVLLGRERIVPITVPHGGRFCVHKLAVYALRGGNNPKSQKDVAQAAVLAAAMSQDQEFMLHDAIDAMDKALRSKAKAGARRAIGLLERDYPEAVDMLAALA
ncbi:MAG: GSU2403 family nucleotidyltransferase fold protein, partial [Betaproteobacteria bacterium]|nr:GSU2403 family nucleotidyltransferase fold protein [Betaproteobacteria bacterium]